MAQTKLDQRILITAGISADSCTAKSIVLPNPKSNCNAAFLFVNGQLLELNCFKQMYSSWFLGAQVVSDGGVYVSTPVDVLFVVLPILERARRSSSDFAGRFCNLEDILSNDQHPDLMLLKDLITPSLCCICDERDIGNGEVYYRLNDERVLAWLQCKVKQSLNALAATIWSQSTSSMAPKAPSHETGTRPSTAASSPSRGQDQAEPGYTNIPVLPSVSPAVQAERLGYVLGMFGEYLADHWLDMLCKHYNVAPTGLQAKGHGGPTPDPCGSAGGHATGTAAAKKPRLDPKEAAREAARKKAAETRAASMAKLAEGTKKISSFFGKPASKT